jgi:hypothetical protein
MHPDFLVRNFRKNDDEYILILVFTGRKQDCYVPKLATII